MTNNPKWEKTRIRGREAEIVRAIASERGESFLDALYHIINFYWDYKRGLLPAVGSTPVQKIDNPLAKTEPVAVEQAQEQSDIDVDMFA